MGKLTEQTEKLVISAAKSEEGAFEKLYDESVDFVYGIVSLYIKDENDRNDVVQNIFTRVYKGLPGLNSPEKYKSWLRMIAKNESLRHIEKEAKHNDALLRFIQSKRFDEEQAGSDPEDDILTDPFTMACLQKAIDELSDPLRKCVVLYYYEGNSVAEIAGILGISEGTVKSRLFAARQKMKKSLEKALGKNNHMFAVPFAPIIGGFLKNAAQAAIAPAGIKASVIGGAAGSTALAGTAALSESGAATSLSVPAAKAAVTTASAAVKITAGAIAAAVAVSAAAVTVATVKKHRDEPPRVTISEAVTDEKFKTDFLNNIGTEIEATAPVPLTTHSVSLIAEVSATEGTSSAASETARSTAGKKTTVQTTAAGTTFAENTIAESTAPVTSPAATATQTPEEGFEAANGVLSTYTGSSDEVIIPASINSQSINAIGYRAFYGNNTIKSVSVPPQITDIGQLSFAECGNLSRVTLADGVKTIGIGAFSDCEKLNSVNIPSSVTSIGIEAFCDCTSLTSITVPGSVTSIGDDAFYGCDNLRIYCASGSAAHEYAEENNIPFKLI